MISCCIWQIQNNRYICPLEHKHITMGNFFTSLFSSSKSEDTAEGKARNRRTEIIITPKLDQFMDLIDQAPDNSSSGIMGDENTKE